ncbi:MAG: hypothetical protein WBM47_00870 [Polyangiales bacterium]
MASPVDERGVDAFRELLKEGNKGPGAKTAALEGLSLRPVWLATWEPKAEGYRTLINAQGEEALAVFSSEEGLKAAAAQFDWLEADGSVATHRAIGGDILRHAWTREYAFVVIDITSTYSLEYERAELKGILKELDSTGPFRTSRPPPPPLKKAAASSFPPPKERPIEGISTMYSMAPSHSEKLDRLSDLPTKPHDVLHDSEPPTQPRAALPEREPPTRRRKSSRPAHKPKSEPAGPKIQEVTAARSSIGDRGTYGAASVIPRSEDRPKSKPPAWDPSESAIEQPLSVDPMSSSAPKLNSDAPTAPAAQPLPTLQPAKLKLPAIGPIGAGRVEPDHPIETPKETKPEAEMPPTNHPPRVAAPSIGDGIKLEEIYDPPDEDLLQTLAAVLRGYFEIEWASYCHVGRPSGGPSPAVGLRVADNYRNNVTAIIKDLCEAARKHEVEIDVLLIDGHDLLRKSREKAFVFYPWKPKG